MREDVARAIEHERSALLAAIQSASGDTWSLPTVCEGWSAKDVLAHLVETELMAGRVYRGEVTTPERPDGETGIGRWTALPGEAVRASLWQHGIATQRVLDTMTDDAWNRGIDVLGRTRIPQLARLHLFELSVHGHDLTDALGLEPVWDARLPFLAEFVVRAAPHAFRAMGVPPHGRLGVRTETGSWTIDGTTGDWSISDEPSEHELELDAATLVLVTTGRLEDGSAMARATVSGDRAAAERTLAAWRVFPTPRSP